jgi:hypothetical protein
MTMERRKTKFLFEFLPQNTFNHAETDLSGRITRLHEERDQAGQSKASDLPAGYILNRVSRHASRWINWDSLSLSPEDATIKTPGAANFVVYPRTFACGTCSSVKQFRSNEVKELTDEDADAVTCDRCGDPLRDYHQMQFVMVCKCGQIQDMYVPEHCGAGMGFRNPGVGFDNAFWYCTADGCNHREEFIPGGKCFNPDCDGEDLEIQPHSASKTFYPQTQTLINVQKNLDTLHTNDTYQTQIVSDYLLHRSGGGNPTDDEVMDKAMALLNEGEADSNQEARELAHERLTVDLNEHRTKTKSFLDEHLDDDQQVRLSEELFEYLSVVDPEYDDGDQIITTTFDELLNDPTTETHLSDRKLKEYAALQDQLDLAEVRLIKNFPITTVTYGYSRLSPKPDPNAEGLVSESPHQSDSGGSVQTDGGVDTQDDPTDESNTSPQDGLEAPPELNLFNTGKWGDTNVFARTTDAEAVMLRLDKDAVLDWLVANDVISSSSVGDVDRWFLSQPSAPGRFERIDPAATITRHCYTLLHTFSHLVVDAIGTLSGYGRDSLVEHMLPRTMSVIIYKRPDTDFSLGSIFTLFEERFDKVVEQIKDGEYCSFNTICRQEHNAACEDCLYLSDITCQNVNYNLSRSTYFGGQFDGDQLRGFADF